MVYLTDSIDISSISPSRKLISIAPHDENLLPQVTKALYVGTGGNIAVVAVDDLNENGEVVFVNVPSGGQLSVRAIQVLATGTTATDIVGFL